MYLFCRISFSVFLLLFSGLLLIIIPAYALDSRCKEIIPGHNQLIPNRINIVLMIGGYDSMPTFGTRLFSDLINGTTKNGYDYDPKIQAVYPSEGLNNIEPYASNSNAINYWYIDTPLFGTGPPCNYVNVPSGTSCPSSGIDVNYIYTFSKYTSYCDVPNKFTHILYKPTSYISTSGHRAYVGSKFSQQDMFADETYTRAAEFTIFVHEFTHSFALVGDEKGDPQYMSGATSTSYPNCFASGAPLTLNACGVHPNVPWRDLIGNGCGKDGVIDCPVSSSFYDINTNKYYTVPQDKWVYEVGEGCAQGCAYHEQNIFRPNMGCNVMSSCDVKKDLIVMGSFNKLGPVNEREACRQIKSITGNVSNYCNNLCLNGCPLGTKCIQGVCTGTITPSPTPTASPSCTLKSSGDADCNGKVDLIDFEIFRKEFVGSLGTKNADFNSTGRVDLVDFEIWRKKYLAVSPVMSFFNTVLRFRFIQ